MKKLNLLPHHILKQQKNHKLQVWMVATLVAIFLCTMAITGALVLVTDLTEFETWQISTAPAHEDALELAIALDSFQQTNYNFNAFLAENWPYQFSAALLGTITNALPERVDIGQFSYTQGRITLIGSTPDIELLAPFRQGLLDSHLFSGVDITGTWLLESGYFSYSLNIGVALDE